MEPTEAIDWPSFLARHDLIWEDLPHQWNEGGFTGNGQLGAMVYADLEENRLCFHLGRADVTDHRKAPDRKTSLGTPGAGVSFDFPRLDLGILALHPAGRIRGGTLRLHLWDAVLRGSVETDRGWLHFEWITLREPMVHRAGLRSTEVSTDGTPLPWRWEWLPGKADAPPAQIKGLHLSDPPADYRSNPEPVLEEAGGVHTCVQPLLAGGDYATAWRETVTDPAAVALFADTGGPFPAEDTDAASVLWISTANEVPASGRSRGVALAAIEEAEQCDSAALREAHAGWWHSYHQRSFLSLPDSRLESYWWAQMFKIGAGVRVDGPALDLHGPWFRLNQWPGLWWNLNVQQSYWPFLPADRLDLGETLLDLMDEHFDALLDAGWVDGEKETGENKFLGDFAWALHNYWLHLRYDGDRRRLCDRWLPKAIRVLEIYESLLEPGEDGFIHLKPMNSPEFNWKAVYPDTNYNLALLRWFLREVGRVLDQSEKNHPRRERWREIESTLVPPPRDGHGLMIGTGQSVDHSHRHFSHLLGLYPLFVFDADDPDIRRLLEQTIEHWLTVEHPERRRDLCQFSLATAASLFAVLGAGDKALGQLSDFLDNRILEWGTIYASQHLPNTFSVETKGRNPTMEAPMAAANATMELVLQSWGGTIRIFPALPADWKEAVFHRFRTEGGFRVSASLRGGRTEWVWVESVFGEEAVLRVKGWDGFPRREGVEATGTPGEFRLRLKPGQSILLLDPVGETLSEPIVQPISHPSGEANPFGLKQGQHLPEKQVWDLR